MNPNHLLVRSTNSAPAAQDFQSAYGTPLIVDRTGKITYFLDSTNTVQAMSGGAWTGAVSTGDLFYGSAPNTISNLSIGSAGKIIRSNGTLPIYSTATYPDTAAAGDIIYASSANTLGNLTVGSVGKLLRSNGTIPAYTTLTFPDTITRGGLPYGSASNVASILAVGSADQVVRTDGTDVSWGFPTKITVADADVSTFPTTLLHFDDDDGSVTITDSGSSPSTWSPTDSSIDTAQSKFGGSSLLFASQGIVETLAFAGVNRTAGWTIDFWCRLNSVIADNGFLFIGDSTGAIALEHWGTVDNKLRLYLDSNGVGSVGDIADYVLGTKNNFATNTWYHFAITRDLSAGKYYVYVDGVKDIEVTSALDVADADYAITPYYGPGGWLDEFRVSPSCLYPSGTTFTPPTSAASGVEHYPMLVPSASGNLAPVTNAALVYNPVSGALYADSFVGAFSGTVTVSDTTDSTCFVALWESQTGANTPKSDGGITYDASAGRLALPTNGSSAGLSIGSGPFVSYYDNVAGWGHLNSASAAGAIGLSAAGVYYSNVGASTTNHSVRLTSGAVTISNATPALNFEDASHTPWGGIVGDSSTSTLVCGPAWRFSNYHDITEISTPSAPSSNNVRVYADDSGGNTRLMALFPTGSAQVLGIQGFTTTDNAIARYDGTSGTLQNSGATIDDSGNITATSFIGPLTGNADTVTHADETSDTSCFITFSTAATGSLPAKTNSNMTFNASTGVATFASTVLTTTDINGGTIDGTVIGGSTPAAATVTTGVANTSLSVGGALTAALFQVTGTTTSATAELGRYNPTHDCTLTTTQYGLDFDPRFSLPGGSVTTIYGVRFNPRLSATSNDVTNFYAASLQLVKMAGHTGTITNGVNFRSETPSISGNPITTFTQFLGETNSTNGAGITSGTVTNRGIHIAAISAAAGAGGTLVNTAGSFTVPSGSAAGNTNYGLRITGNGGAASANWALYNDSTADNIIVGDVRIGSTSAPTVALDVTGSGAFSGSVTVGDAPTTRTSLGLGTLTYPLMDYGGYQFDGATDYLDTNALTGIADGKKGTIVAIVRFANSASASEQIIGTTGGALVLQRTSTGNIQVLAENAAGTTILSQVSSGTPCSAAGTYVIMVSWDLATGGSFRMYINDTAPSVTSTTFTDDTIDYTVTEYSIGANSAGSLKVTGDMYVIWFDATNNLELNTTSVRRKFTDPNNVPMFLGSHGELPTGSPPILFLAYSSYENWPRNRGISTTSFTENGTPGAPTTALSGQVGPIDNVGRTAVRSTNVGNVGSGEDNLITYVIPAGRIAARDCGVRITAWGTTANNANAKTLKVYFGSQQMMSTSLTTSIAGVWRVNAEVVSTGVDAQDYVCQLVQGGTTLNDVESGTATQDDGASITVKCTGEATSNNDIVQEGLIVELIG